MAADPQRLEGVAHSLAEACRKQEAPSPVEGVHTPVQEGRNQAAEVPHIPSVGARSHLVVVHTQALGQTWAASDRKASQGEAS